MLYLPSGPSLGGALVAAMNAIEADFAPLQGSLPKDYDRFDNKLLEILLRCFDSQALRQATGDVFGRICEYFLMKFVMQVAQDNGEFFTPPSLVQMLVNIIEPDHGVMADLACGSGSKATCRQRTISAMPSTSCKTPSWGLIKGLRVGARSPRVVGGVVLALGLKQT